MALREKVTESILKYTCISEAKADEKRRFYYKNYEDNLYCPLGEAALEAYDKGSGAETRPAEKTVKDEDKAFVRRERVSSYKRSYYVGDRVSETYVKAKYDSGVLTLFVPKKKDLIPEKKNIAID